MRQHLDFLCILTKIKKALDESGVKVLDMSGSKEGLMLRVEHESKQYGMYILDETELVEAMKSHLCHAPTFLEKN